MPLLLAFLLFAVFAANVAVGSAGGKVFLSDVQEMLVLLAASVSFVVAILKKEALRRQQGGGETVQREDKS